MNLYDTIRESNLPMPYLQRYAIKCARFALTYWKQPDKRSVAAIDAAERYLNGNLTKDELAKAITAAYAAHTAAAARAYAAAYAAAHAAAHAAAAHAAHAAAPNRKEAENKLLQMFYEDLTEFERVVFKV